jgi:hypothetical protein
MKELLKFYNRLLIYRHLLKIFDKFIIMYTEYSPIDPDFYDVIESVKKKNVSILIHYFGLENELNDARGEIMEITINKKHEEYLVLNSRDTVRLDRIIVLNGRPGPAFDEYDSYALACLDCTGGME